MRSHALAAALLLGLTGCSLSIEPDKVPEPAFQGCVPTGCAGKGCGYNDCGNVCQPGSGCTGTCTPFCSGLTCGSSDGCGATCSVGSGCTGTCTPSCSGVTCGSSDGCGATCVAGSGCTGGGTGFAVQGGITSGAAQMSGASHQVQKGTLSHGASGQSLQGTTYRIEQGTLR